MKHAILRITIRELKRIFTLPYMKWVLVVMPPVLFFFYAAIYQQQKLKDLPVAVWDEDQTDLTRKLCFMLEQTETVKLNHTVYGRQELEDGIRSGKFLGCIYFPKHFTSSVKSRKPATITAYTNAAAMVQAKLIYKEIATLSVMGSLGVVIEKLTKMGTPTERVEALAQPIKLQTYYLYNADYNYQRYLVPGLITVALQMMWIMVAVLLINREKKEGLFGELVQLSNRSAANILLGKLLAHTLVAWLNFILITGVIFPYYQLSVAGAVPKLLVVYTLLVWASYALGLAVSAWAADSMIAADLALFYTSPAFVFSGFTFPRWAMPWYDQFYAQLLPYTHFLEAYFTVWSMNLPLRYASSSLYILLLFILFGGSTAWVGLRRLVKKEEAYA